MLVDMDDDGQPPRDAADALQQATREIADYKYALDQASIVAITDVKGTIRYVNDKFCEISGYTREELIGQDHRILNSSYHPKSFIRNMWRTIARGQVWRGELRNRAKGGDIYWVDTTIVPLLDAAGKPRQYLAIRTDITDRKHIETLLRQKETMAQLGQMSAVIAHEVKNPLAGISGAIQVIATRFEPGSGDREVLEEMRERIAALDRSLTGLLTFARPAPPELAPVSVATILAKGLMFVANDPCFAEASLEVVDSDVVVLADAELLGRAVMNLVMNALQATDGAGAVRVVATERERDVEIVVTDDGPGLPDGDVFRPFFTTKISGAGLGLAVARQTVEAHGGGIAAENMPGGGARVTMRIPRPVSLSGVDTGGGHRR